MTTEKEKPVPGIPDRALEKAASLATANIKLTWLLNSQGKKIGSGVGIDGKCYSADDNTRLIAALFDEIARLNRLTSMLPPATKSWFDPISRVISTQN